MSTSKRLSKRIVLFFTGTMLIGLVVRTAYAETSFYKEVFKNDRVRLYELKFNPGERWAIRKPGHDYLIYVLEGDEFTLLHPYTSGGITKAQAGKVLWFPADKRFKPGSSKEAQLDPDILAVEVIGSLQPSWKDDRFQKAENVGSSVVRILVIEFREAADEES